MTGLMDETDNILLIGGVAAAVFLYAMYQQRNGRPVAAAPARKKVQ